MSKVNLSRVFGSFEVRLFLTVWLIYALHVVPGGGVNANRYFDLTHSLVNQRTTNIDAYHENTIDKGFKDGHYYSLGLPGPSILGIPAYLTFKIAYKLAPASLVKPLANVQSLKQGQQTGFYQQDNTEFFLSTIWITWFSLSLLSAFAAVILFKLFLGLGVSQVNSLIGTAAYAFGTPAFFYSTTYFSAGFAASFVILALYLLLKSAKNGGSLLFLWLGLASGAAVLMEYQTLFLAAGIALYVLLRTKLKTSWSFFVGAGIPCAVLLIYNALSFGGPFHSAYQYVVGPNAEFHNVGALGFTVPRPERLFGLTLSTHRGLFVYSPVLLLSFVGFFYGLRRRRQPAYAIVLLSILASFGVWIWISSFQAWDGSSAFGPRLLVCILPLMAIGVALSLSRVPKIISIPLIILSVAINWLGAQNGFAENIWEPWRRLLNSGFTLPAFSALVSHSRGENGLTLFITQRMWLIAGIYFALIIGSLFLLISTLRRRGKSASDVAENRIPLIEPPQLFSKKEISPLEDVVGAGNSAHSHPFVSVIMPVRNEAAFIGRSLGSVLAQDYSPERMQILIADGMSSDGTRQIISEIQQRNHHVITIDNVGEIVATGLNTALLQAKGEIIVRVDGHCEIAPDYIRRCVSHLTNDSVEAVGGPVETVGESYVARVIATAMSSRFGVGDSAFRVATDKTQLTDTVAFPAYKRAAIDRAGPFDEELVRNQDDEYNYRLRKLGVKILLAADVRSRYYSRANFIMLGRQYFQYGFWKVRVMQKHPGQMQLRQFVPPLFVTSLIAALILLPVLPVAGYLLGLIAGSYAVAALTASVISGRKKQWQLLPLLPLAFAILHVAYGSGFLFGLLRFWNRWGGRENKIRPPAAIRTNEHESF